MASFSSTAARWPATGRAPAAGRPTTRPAPWRCGTPSSRPTPRTTAAGASCPTATTSIDAAAGCPPPSTDERGVVRPQGASCEIGAVEASPVTATSREDCGNCVDDDGDGRTDYEDPACCAQTAAMQVKKALIVPGPAGAMKGNLSLIAILAQAGFADVDPTRDDVTVQFRNPNGELLCANIAHQRWKHGSRRGPFQFGDPTGTVAQGLRKMQIKVSKSGSARFLTAGKKMDLGRYRGRSSRRRCGSAIAARRPPSRCGAGRTRSSSTREPARGRLRSLTSARGQAAPGPPVRADLIYPGRRECDGCVQENAARGHAN